ncbi:hypothetical protein AAMO2058_001224100 [Amorphochlora amoebiformis]
MADEGPEINRNHDEDFSEFKTSEPKRRLNQKHGFMRQIVHIQKNRAHYEDRMRQRRKMRSAEMREEKNAEAEQNKHDEDREDYHRWVKSQNDKKRESRGSGADSGQWQRGKEVERPSAKRITTRTSSHYVPKALREKQQNGRKVRHGREAANRSERSREGQGSRMKGRQPRDKDTREGRGRGGRGSKGRARGERGRRRRKAKVSMEDLDAEEREIRRQVAKLRLRLEEIQQERDDLRKIAQNSKKEAPASESHDTSADLGQEHVEPSESVPVVGCDHKLPDHWGTDEGSVTASTDVGE